MSKTQLKEPNLPEEDARVGYQVAVEIAYNYATIIWSIFNAMLLANSIVVAGAILLFTGKDKFPIFKALLPLAGLVLCAIWFLLSKRTQEQARYFIYSAREIEEQHLVPTVKTVSFGGEFADGKSVSLTIGDKSMVRQLSFWGRMMSGERASYMVVCVFAVLYLVLLCHL